MEKCLEAYSEHSGISKMELLAKFINSFNSLTTFVKSSILEVWLCSEYASGAILWHINIQVSSIVYHTVNKHEWGGTNILNAVPMNLIPWKSPEEENGWKKDQMHIKL